MIMIMILIKAAILSFNSNGNICNMDDNDSAANDSSNV